LVNEIIEVARDVVNMTASSNGSTCLPFHRRRLSRRRTSAESIPPQPYFGGNPITPLTRVFYRTDDGTECCFFYLFSARPAAIQKKNRTFVINFKPFS
jgi:hypothetical protein